MATALVILGVELMLVVKCLKIQQQQLAKMVPIPNLYFSVELKVTKPSGKY